MPRVMLYTIPNCPECQAVKEFLEERGVAFQECDVAHNFGNLRQMRRLTPGRRVPVTALAGMVVVGFDPAALLELIRKQEEASHADGS
jgi:glutaredoxin 3